MLYIIQIYDIRKFIANMYWLIKISVIYRNYINKKIQSLIMFLREVSPRLINYVRKIDKNINKKLLILKYFKIIL